MIYVYLQPILSHPSKRIPFVEKVVDWTLEIISHHGEQRLEKKSNGTEAVCILS